MKYTWRPTAPVNEKGEALDPVLEGEVEVDLPKYVTRLKYLKEANFKINQDGTVNQDVNPLDFAIKAIEMAEKHIKKVNLKVLESGQELKKVDDLQFSREGEAVLTEIGMVVLNGPN